MENLPADVAQAVSSAAKLRRYLNQSNLDIVIRKKDDSPSNIGAGTSRIGDSQRTDSMEKSSLDWIFSDKPLPGWSREKTLAIKRSLAERIKPRPVISLVSAGSVTVRHRGCGSVQLPIMEVEYGDTASKQHWKRRIVLVPKSRSEQGWVMYFLRNQRELSRYDLLAIVNQGCIVFIDKIDNIRRRN